MLESRTMNHRLLGFVLVLVFASSLLLTAQTAAAPAVEITAEPDHHLAFKNEYVRVFELEVAPNASTLLHHHRHDYIYVNLGISQVENDVQGKPPVKLTLQDGETHFVPGGFVHLGKNLSDRPFRNVTIELLQDEKARHAAPPKWGVNGDDDRGLHVLNGGTVDILFAKDGARVSDLELQPGGVLPKHHRAGPQLLVAVTDVDLRVDVEGKGPTQIQLKAGDVSWEKGGATHALTNIGKQNAKLITVEFQP